MASGEAPGERLSAGSTKGHVEPVSPREGLGASVAEPPRKTARGTAGDNTGAGGPAGQTREQQERSRGPGALEEGGTHSRAEVAATGAALVLHHPAPVVLTQHQQRRLVGRTHQLMLHHAVRAPAQLQPGETGSARHTQHGRGVRKAKGAGGAILHIHQPTRRNGSSASRCPPPPHGNQECAGCTTVCVTHVTETHAERQPQARGRCLGRVHGKEMRELALRASAAEAEVAWAFEEKKYFWESNSSLRIPWNPTKKPEQLDAKPKPGMTLKTKGHRMQVGGVGLETPGSGQ